MRTIYSLLILAAVSLPALVSAADVPVDRKNESVTLPVPTTPKPLCEEKICPRLYWPVCSLVDGQQVTAPSPCVLNNKISCSRMLRRSLGRKVPTIRFLHAGSCSSERDRSNVIRMRDDADVASRGHEASSQQTGNKDASFEEMIDEMIDEILNGDSGESIESDEDDEDLIDRLLSGDSIESDEDDEDIIDRILSGDSIESGEDSDDIIDGIPESVENGGDGIGDLEEIDDDYDEAELDDDKGEYYNGEGRQKLIKAGFENKRSGLRLPVTLFVELLFLLVI